MVESTALLLYNRHPAYRSIIPGKAFEYIGARRPIVAVIPPDSEMHTLIRDHADARVIAPDGISQFGAVVEQLLAEHRAGAIQGPRVPESVAAPFRRGEQAKKLAEIFARIAR
jgi:hypothetical protein